MRLRKGMTTEKTKAVNNAQLREWHRKHPGYRHETLLKWRRQAMEILGGAECVSCGCDEFSALEFNHIGGGGSKEQREQRQKFGYRFLYDILKGRRRIDDLNILCRPCNSVEYLKRKYPTLNGKWKIEWESEIR